MALWPNNYRGFVGVLPYRKVGISAYYYYSVPPGSQRNIHTSLAKTASIPEGAAPTGAWVWPRVAGGMATSGKEIDFTGTLSILRGGAISGTTTAILSGDNDLSLRVYLNGTDKAIDFVVPASNMLAAALLGASSQTVTLYGTNDLLLRAYLNGSETVLTLTSSASLASALLASGTGTFTLSDDCGLSLKVYMNGTEPVVSLTIPTAALVLSLGLSASGNVVLLDGSGNVVIRILLDGSDAVLSFSVPNAQLGSAIAITGQADTLLAGNNDLSLRAYATATETVFTLTVPASNLIKGLKAAGLATAVFDFDNNQLSIIEPAGGTFLFTVQGSSDVRARLTMSGEFSNIGEQTPDYGGAVYVADWGADAFSYPAGTATQPVATWACAQAIAAKYNLHDYYIKGNFTLDAPLSNSAIYGWGPLQFNKVNLNDQLLTSVHFHDCVLEGKLNTETIGGGGWQNSIARVEFTRCYLQSIEDLQGTASYCQIEGSTLIKAGGWLSGTKIVIEGDFTVFDMRSASGTTVSLDIDSGWAQFINAVDGCLIELNLKGGEVSLYPSCVGGEYYLEGIATLFNESAMTVKENHLPLDEPLEYHQIAGSEGAQYPTFAIALEKILGLAGSNFVMDNVVKIGRQISSADLHVYPTRQDTIDRTNELHSYKVTVDVAGDGHAVITEES